MVVIGGILGFAAAMGAVSWWLRRMDRNGYWDRRWESSSSKPGLRWFFDTKDGTRQR